MSAAPHGDAGGPWWVTSATWERRRLTLKFKMTPGGYPSRVKVIALEGSGPITPARFRRETLAAAHAYCERHRAEIAAAFAVAAGAPSGVYRETVEAAPCQAAPCQAAL